MTLIRPSLAAEEDWSLCRIPSFLYLPYFQFPVDGQRLSGILTPGIGYDDTTGTNVILPIYWNQAPNYDMTITPAWYSKLGMQLNTKNRYLFGSQRGQVDLCNLDDRDFGDSRWFQQWRHEARLPFDVKARLLPISCTVYGVHFSIWLAQKIWLVNALRLNICVTICA